MTYFRFAILVIALGFGFASPTFASVEDEAGVRQAILNYVNSFYNTDPELAKKSVWENIAKRGYWHDNAGEPYRGPLYMTYEQLLSGAARIYAKNPPGPDAPKEITLFEVSDKIASAKVVAAWGFDYIHLTKIDGTWKIVNVLWQAYPDPANH